MKAWMRTALELATVACLAIACAPAVAEGHIDFEWRTNASGIPGVRASFLLRATREDLWALLVDYRRFPEIFRNVLEVRSVGEGPDRIELEFVVNAVVMRVRYVLDRRYVERGRRITWTKLSGDLQRIEGSWTIADGPTPGLVAVTYESYVEFKWYVPDFAVRARVAEEVEAMVQAMRRRLETPAQPPRG
jgi:ribosome-associated toxin RatA of RatAB toxin-antitoxin module